MKCPTDQTTLVMSERSGVEIDYCPECRGVWLDRGELDKIIERAEAPAAPAPRYGERGSDNRGSDNRGQDNRGSDNGYRPKKKENWLGELFG